MLKKKHFFLTGIVILCLLNINTLFAQGNDQRKLFAREVEVNLKSGSTHYLSDTYEAINSYEQRQRGWTSIFSDDFEGSFPGTSWTVTPLNADAYWDTWTCWAYNGSNSCGAAAGGSLGISCGSTYPANIDSWMVHGPFSLDDLTISDAELNFYWNLNLPGANNDRIGIYASINGLNFYGVNYYGSTISPFSFDLTDVPYLGNLIGQSQVWIAFRFISDGSIQTTNGAQIDNVIIQKYSPEGDPEIDVHPLNLSISETNQMQASIDEFNLPIDPQGSRALANPFLENIQESYSLPDQQRLLYDRFAHSATSSECWLVKIHPEALASPNPLCLNVQDDENYYYSRHRTEKRSENDISWFGKGGKEFKHDAIIVIQANEVSGIFHTSDYVFSLKPLGYGMHILIRLDIEAFPPDHPPEYWEMEHMSSTESHSVNTPHKHHQSRDDGAYFSVIVAYTPASASAVGNISSLIQLAVDESNQSYVNSDINPRMRLVHSYQTSYTESGDFNTDLTRFRTPSDGYMDEIHSFRETYKADVCVLIIDNNAYCGLASDILADESTAFCAVHWDCATGYYSFAHEIGHLQGCRHNPENDPTTSPFEYGHGFLYTTGGWRTIMAYNDAANCPGGYCTRLQYWSNPDIDYGGIAMGSIADHDNARVLDETALIISNLRIQDSSNFFFVNNAGPGILLIDSITQSSDWLWVGGHNGFPASVAPNDSIMLQAGVLWDEVGRLQRYDTLNIFNTDPDESPFQVVVTAIPDSLIPPARHLGSDTIYNGENYCYDASDTITTAGNSAHFHANSGSELSLISGGRIILKEGTFIHEGSSFLASITINELFCPIPPSAPLVGTIDYENNELLQTTVNKQFKIWPVPASDQINIQWISAEKPSDCQIRLFDYLGRLQLIKRINTSEIYHLDVRELPKGIYLLNINYENSLFTEKIIIQ